MLMTNNQYNKQDKFPSSRNTFRSSSLSRTQPSSQSTTSTSSTDSWKILTSKLDNIKSSKEKFGKIEKKLYVDDDNTIDELKCKHFSTCSGCSIKGNFTETLLINKAKKYFFNNYKIKLNIIIYNITEWRTHVKLAVQPLSKWGGLKFGLYRSNTHIVESIPDCKVHHPYINQGIKELYKHCIDLNIKGYHNDKNNNNNNLQSYSSSSSSSSSSQGELRYIQMSLDRISKRIQLTLVWNTNTFKDAEQSLPRLVKRLKGRSDLWHSVTVNFQTSDSNTIFNYNPKSWKTLWGPPLLREKVGDASFYFQPQIFRQANLDAFEQGIIPLIAKHIPPQAIIAELYAGIGLVGLNMAKYATEVYCSDSNEYIDGVFDKCADSLAEVMMMLL